MGTSSGGEDFELVVGREGFSASSAPGEREKVREGDLSLLLEGVDGLDSTNDESRPAVPPLPQAESARVSPARAISGRRIYLGDVPR